MFDFKGITHVIENPAGHAAGFNFSLVGAVPLSMLEAHTPTRADICAGRVQADGKAYGPRRWETIDQILTAAATNGVRLCTSKTCACRRLFTVVE